MADDVINANPHRWTWHHINRDGITQYLKVTPDGPVLPECLCHYDQETGVRLDVVCPRHDGVFTDPPVT